MRARYAKGLGFVLSPRHPSLFLFDKTMVSSVIVFNSTFSFPPPFGGGRGRLQGWGLYLTPPRPKATPLASPPIPLSHWRGGDAYGGWGVSFLPPLGGSKRGGASRFCSQNYNILKPCCPLSVVFCSLRSFFSLCFPFRRRQTGILTFKKVAESFVVSFSFLI